jgi:hypothetical protein
MLALKRREPDRARAETCFRRAIEIARGQEARMLELRAATDLAQVWCDRDSDRDLARYWSRSSLRSRLARPRAISVTPARSLPISSDRKRLSNTLRRFAAAGATALFGLLRERRLSQQAASSLNAIRKTGLLKGFGRRPFAGALGLGAGLASESLVRRKPPGSAERRRCL